MNNDNISPAGSGPLSDADADRLARQVHQHPDYRVLRRIADPHSAGTTVVPPGGRRIAVVDSETSGLNPAAHEIIELAIMIVVVDAYGRVVGHEAPVSWLQQPEFSLDPEITRITGITNAMLEGQRIDRDAALAMLSGVECILAHNAVFDREFAEKLLPELRNSVWACTCRDIDWAQRGYEGRALGWLLNQAGMFSDTHRAAADVWALFTLLTLPDFDGATPLQMLLAYVDQSMVRIEATGSDFDDRKWLKQWGYSWNKSAKVWHKTIPVDAIDAERENLLTIRVRNPAIIAQAASDRHRS
ncbi:MAG: 3'-5' exonuclease [Sphingorhabdus sp.]